MRSQVPRPTTNVGGRQRLRWQNTIPFQRYVKKIQRLWRGDMRFSFRTSHILPTNHSYRNGIISYDSLVMSRLIAMKSFNRNFKPQKVVHYLNPCCNLNLRKTHLNKSVQSGWGGGLTKFYVCQIIWHSPKTVEMFFFIFIHLIRQGMRSCNIIILYVAR